MAQINRHYLDYGAGRVVRRLTSYTLFEGRPHTTRGQWFNPVVFALLRGFAGLPGSPSVDRPIFITGMGRSGTTLLGTLLSLHRDVGFLNEPKALWTTINPHTDINGDYQSSGGLFRMDATHASTRQRLRARRLFGRYLAVTRSSRVVDKYPELIFRLGYVFELFPNARIIFITRNGADACESVEAWSAHHGVRSGDRVDDWWGRNAIKWRYLCEQILTREARYAALASLDLPALDHLNRAALEWVVTMQVGIEQQNKYPHRVVRVAYEALVENPESEIRRILKACGLDHDPAIFDYAARYLYRTKSRFAPRLLAPVQELFEQTYDGLGYQQNH